MRLQLVTLAIVLLTRAGLAAGQDAEPGDGEAQSRVFVYSDDDATTVTSSVVDVQATLPGMVTLGAHGLVDAVSSASIDVVSAATGRWEETRVEAGARAAILVKEVTASVSYTRSQENDWLSNTVGVGIGSEFFSRNTRVDLAYAVTLNDVGRARDPVFEETLRGHTAELSVSQLVDRVTRVGGALTVQLLNGFQSSVYRYVLAEDGTRVREAHPEKRKRYAISTFATRALASWLALRASYRLYVDDWGIVSHTPELRLSFEPSPRWNASISARFYRQGDADFYRERYMTAQVYMTSDRELARFWDVGGNGSLRVNLGRVSADAKVGAVYYKFANFERLPTRLALVASAGASLKW